MNNQFNNFNNQSQANMQRPYVPPLNQGNTPPNPFQSGQYVQGGLNPFPTSPTNGMQQQNMQPQQNPAQANIQASSQQGGQMPPQNYQQQFGGNVQQQPQYQMPTGQVPHQFNPNAMPGTNLPPKPNDDAEKKPSTFSTFVGTMVCILVVGVIVYMIINNFLFI